MADSRLGGTYVDVSLRFAEFEKGLKEAERRAKAGAKKIEESFMVKYTTGFVEKETARASETALKRQFDNAKKYAILDAETAQQRIADQKALNAKLSEAAQLEAERMRIILGENEALDKHVRTMMQITKENQKANQMMAGMKAVPLPAAMGGRGFSQQGSQQAVNQRAMNMAQLSYAIQDFATGMAMGNFNMAVMGASNNLGMMAQSIGPVAGGLTVIAAALLPHAISAIEKFEGSTKRAADGVMYLKRAYDEFQDSLSRKARVSEAMFKIGEMQSTPEAVSRLRELKNQQDIEGKMTDERDAERKRIKAEIKKSEVRLTGIAGMLLNPEAKPGVTRTITMEQREQLLKQIKDLDDADKKAGKDRSDKAKEIEEIEKRIADLKRQSALDIRNEMNLRTGSSLEADEQRAMDDRERRLKRIEEEAPENQKAALKKRANDILRQDMDDAKARDKISKKRLELELKPYSTPAQHARLRAEEEYQRNLREIQKRPVEERTELEKKAKDKLAADNKKIDADEARTKRRMQADLISGINEEQGARLKIQNDLKDKIEEINKMELDDAERQKMIRQAHAGAAKAMSELGNPRGSFAGLVEGAKRFQTAMSGNQFDARIADSTAGMKETLDAILRDGLKVQNGGVGP